MAALLLVAGHDAEERARWRSVLATEVAALEVGVGVGAVRRGGRREACGETARAVWARMERTGRRRKQGIPNAMGFMSVTKLLITSTRLICKP